MPCHTNDDTMLTVPNDVMPVKKLLALSIGTVAPLVPKAWPLSARALPVVLLNITMSPEVDDDGPKTDVVPLIWNGGRVAEVLLPQKVLG